MNTWELRRIGSAVRDAMRGCLDSPVPEVLKIVNLSVNDERLALRVIRELHEAGYDIVPIAPV